MNQQVKYKKLILIYKKKVIVKTRLVFKTRRKLCSFFFVWLANILIKISLYNLLQIK